MPKKEKAADLVERIRKYSVADEVEVIVYTTRNALTRFANNVIHQNLAEENVAVSVRTVFAGRTARATTNKIDDEGLKRVVKASENLAKVQHPDPDLLPMADAREGSSSGQIPTRHFERTAAMTPEERAERVRAIVAVAEKHRLTTAGIVSTSEVFEGIFNGRGLSTWHTQTAAEVSITMLGPDSSGWQKANSPNVDNLDVATLAESAARKAAEAAKPREIPAGKYTVILEPAAVLDLVGFMFYDFGGLAVLDQRSFLNDRVGTQLFGKNINIWDDVAHPLQSGAPFDGEGIGRKKVQLVEKGVVQRLVYARGTASRMSARKAKIRLDRLNLLGTVSHSRMRSAKLP